MFIQLNRKGQNTLEYVLLITSVVVAFIAIQYYLNRGLQGRVREASDNIGSQFDAGATTSSVTTTRSSMTQDITAPTGNPEGGSLTQSILLDDEATMQNTTEQVQAPVNP